MTQLCSQQKRERHAEVVKVWYVISKMEGGYIPIACNLQTPWPILSSEKDEVGRRSNDMMR